ncbi:MAG: SDR family NAD(P)-dependent oxidoreductase [Candidatus Bipolaricaulota bacterium]
MKQLENKTALVTGAASGIGRHIALQLAEEGAAVTVADIRQEPRESGKPTHELITEQGGSAQFLKADVSKVEELEDVINSTFQEFGSLDIMVNNAGIYPGLVPIEEIDEESYDKLMEVNLKGAFFGSKLAAEKMKEEGIEGSIVNISSIAGLVGFQESSTYCASKGGITNLTRELALELGPDGIRVNAINPGVIETAMTTQDEDVAGTMVEQIPLRRDGKPGDIADAAVFLASDRSSYITGHNLVVDGGFTAQ